MKEAVHYRVSMSRPHSHLFEVEARFPPGQDVLDAVLPVWTPGSYLVREYARHLQDVTAVGPRGEALPLHRVDKRTFRVKAGGQAVTVRYRVYANELTVRTSHLDGSHGYFNGATLFLYTEATRHHEHRVTVVAPEGWRTFCALEGEGETFIAPDYDELVDSPFEIGPHTPLSFTAAGVPHEVVIWGDTVPDAERLTADLQRICEAQARLFNGLPMRRYLFLVYLTDKGRGGLEHKNSTALLFPRAGLQTLRGWEDFLTLAAHEYFHLWNIKRIKPRAFVPFDYSQENYTTLLWAFEGMTSYYDNLFVRRAGLMSAQRYLTRLGETFTQLHGTPGRRSQTLADASLLSWIKHYRPDENSPNSAISYYLKGEVVCVLLDLEIRRATDNLKGLDDVLRLLWRRYGDGSGMPEEGMEAAVQEVTGRDFTPFFDLAVRSTRELDYSVLAHVGLQVEYRVRESANDKGGTPPPRKNGEVKPRGWLGLTTKGSATLATVLEDSPAMEAGLTPEDELVALDGYKVDAANLLSRCEDKRPGDTVRLTVFRRDKLMEFSVVLGQKPADAIYLTRVDKLSDAQKAAFQSWLGATWDETLG
ncbi:M61 family metallopeptidase [Stigmatella aurantiaca]|uniref:Peptidase M61 n=1 Tax=Stigmatella aurantiaca (strain DW4/3-1) TaxID=378806 RepID=Q08X62_STIAD|nr:PDZ domain-containing protein [Stigmatella aurantiaca]ADO71103.1 Peptidase M61 [Stigmatella aurantiaca DW4/3-1]EAU65072.1 peptidase M61 [Stigmatella aurantiaca DW4/3-1]